MNKNWTLREAIYEMLHRWPSLIAFFAVGCLLGWGASLIWPSFYRATSQIYVGLNPYRAYSDTNFLALTAPKYSNVDNYNLFQMSQLDGVIFLDEYLQETLKTLQRLDPYWEGTTVDQLRLMLDAGWRSAGAWSLVVEHPDSKRAEQVAQAWSQVVKKNVKDSVASAQKTFMTDQHLESITAERTKAELRRQELFSTRAALQSWEQSLQLLPAGQPLEPAARWKLFALAARLAQFTPGWVALLQDQPAPDSPPESYLGWIDQIIPYMDAELSALGEQIQTLEQKSNELAEQYTLESQNSLGLSPNIEIKELESLPTRIIRPTSRLVLIGGIIGLLIWLLTILVIIARRAESK